MLKILGMCWICCIMLPYRNATFVIALLGFFEGDFDELFVVFCWLRHWIWHLELHYQMALGRVV